MPCSKYKGKQRKLCYLTKEWTDFSKVRKGQLDLSTIVGLVVGLLVYVLGLYPIVNTAIQDNFASFDPITQGTIVFVPLVFLLAIFIGLFSYAFGRRPSYEGLG